ncbi:RNA polymerase sigma factor [Brachyspira alvinipulli]|uniref:RNA polymerase sigma factor n=1 Tax=Brachyspira alvinipulli TaxID=84379 RepID=UPI000485BB9F|nr:sigma factor [Brachyspira alvinipulli]
MWKILDLIDSIDRNHQSYIYKVYSKVGNFEDANDIMQDIYMELLNKIENGFDKNGYDQLDGYIFIMINSRVTDFFRKKNNKVNTKYESKEFIDELFDIAITDNDINDLYKEYKEGLFLFIDAIVKQSMNTVCEKCNMCNQRLSNIIKVKNKNGEDIDDSFSIYKEYVFSFLNKEIKIKDIKTKHNISDHTLEKIRSVYNNKIKDCITKLSNKII